MLGAESLHGNGTVWIGGGQTSSSIESERIERRDVDVCRRPPFAASLLPAMSFMSRTPAPGERGDARACPIAPPSAGEAPPAGGNPWPSAPPPWVDDRTTQRCMGRACTVRAPPRVPPARRPREGTTGTPTSA